MVPVTQWISQLTGCTCCRRRLKTRQQPSRQQYICLTNWRCHASLSTLMLQRRQLAAHTLMQRRHFDVWLRGACNKAALPSCSCGRPQVHTPPLRASRQSTQAGCCWRAWVWRGELCLLQQQHDAVDSRCRQLGWLARLPTCCSASGRREGSYDTVVGTGCAQPPLQLCMHIACRAARPGMSGSRPLELTQVSGVVKGHIGSGKVSKAARLRVTAEQLSADQVRVPPSHAAG